MGWMMKRSIVMLLAAALGVSLTACEGPAGEAGKRWELRREKFTEEEAARQPEAGEVVTIETACGQIQGIQQDGYREFRGVRYAAAGRWEQAQGVTGWEGVYDATRWGDRACQHLGFYRMADSAVSQFYLDESLVMLPAQYSEDCLNLNIWTPDEAEGCPVLVYIHGGSFMTGSNTDPSTDGEAYTRCGVVVVSINYRLGLFGTVQGDGHTGNLALTDQLTALRWVRDNIADYGGDPARITVMGESAGAVSVQDLLISPLVEEGLISGAIMLSGGGDLSELGTPTDPALQERIWKTVKAGAGADSIEELKDMPAKELYELWLRSLGAYGSVATAPALDGKVLVCDVGDALEAGTVKDVPCMFGVLSEDMYPLSLYDAAARYGRQRAEAGGKPVYLYFFDRQQPGENAFGAFHAADLYYVFGTLYRNWRPFDDVDYRISKDMISYIANFVKTGDPNGPGLAQWEAATAQSQAFLHFGDEEAAMIEPDRLALSNAQIDGSPFPYAEFIEPPAAGAAT